MSSLTLRKGLWDHPRVGGEKLWYDDIQRRRRGSPPRGRGKGQALLADDTGIGITPAWAGKRRKAMPIHVFYRDHPRVGGEKLSRGVGGINRRGSPPRGRGKVACKALGIGADGITPAWAGKSDSDRNRRTAAGDHPRVGGEKYTTQKKHRGRRGSPPRGRGKD